MGWWASRVRRLVRYFRARVSTAERRELTAWLTSDQLALFESMHGADQRHGLDVVAALRAAGHRQPDLLLAGLLHDCGKGRELHVWHRIAWSLGERYGTRLGSAFARLPTFARAFRTMADHARVSADLAFTAGVSPLTADLIRNQAEPLDPELGRALLLADQAN